MAIWLFFFITNQIQQGGMPTLNLFNFYMDYQTVKLRDCWTACKVGDYAIVPLMHAEDLVLL